MVPPLAVLTGCLTRWDSKVAAIIRLLLFEEAMQVVLINKKQEIVGMLKDAQRAAELFQLAHLWSPLAEVVPSQNCCLGTGGRRSQAGSGSRADWLSCRPLQLQSAQDSSLGMALVQDGSQAVLPGIHFASSQTPAAHQPQPCLCLHQQHHSLLTPAASQQHHSKSQATPSSFTNDLFPYTPAQATAVYRQMAAYMGKAEVFSNSMLEYTDSKDLSATFWLLMTQPAPTFARLASHLFTIAVSSAAVSAWSLTSATSRPSTESALLMAGCIVLPPSSLCCQRSLDPNAKQQVASTSAGKAEHPKSALRKPRRPGARLQNRQCSNL